ncbi:MAG: thymidine kinase [Blautia sp.]|nr:thymidine kinase [Blautia sp.]
MPKLYFRYGAMGSSKSANALMVRYNYAERGQKVHLLKPRTDTRDGERVIFSRIGISAPCEYVDEFIEFAEANWHTREDALDCAAVIIDEAQFMTPSQVDYMAHIVDDLYVPVICYGLRTDFQQKLFPGALRLFELADVIEQVPTVCWCGARAQCNARIKDGHIVREGEQVFLGGNESYISLCRRHFLQGLIAPPAE